MAGPIRTPHSNLLAPMKNNQPVTQREHTLRGNSQLISTTDLKGVIISANDEFVQISGYSRAELIGQSHNLVRHPDMPPAAFADLWSSLRQGLPWMGLVKNRCKNGDHYYVDAYVTPIFEGDRVVGYQSARVQPERAVVQRAEQIYRRLRLGQSAWWSRLSPAQISYRYKFLLVALLATAPALIAGEWLLAAITAVLALAGGWLLVAPLLTLAARSRALFRNAVAQEVYSGRGDEIGAIETTLLAQRAQSRTILGRVSYAVTTLGEVAEQTSRIVNATTAGVRRQQTEVDMVATAMNEMTATVHEVARNAEETARASQDVLVQTGAGDKLVLSSLTDIENLSTAVDAAKRVIEDLREESKSIGSVVDVISNIASETNLLALNAAIEAARAGEQGRGFAVVADEVRNLASHTQKSTDEIQQMVKRIQQSSEDAVAVMQQGQQRAVASVEISRQVGSSFREISDSIDHITQMNAQVATASEEQNAVSEEINRNLVQISNIATSTLSSADETAVTSARLFELVTELKTMLKQFGAV
jgi:aerotaxis receptor